jgi:hypothetical protein
VDIISTSLRKDHNIVTYLGSEVESQVTASKTVLNKQGHLLGQVQLYRAGQVGRFAEVDEVLEGEGQGDGFGERDGNVLVGLVDVGVLADGNGAVTNVTGAREFDTLLAGLDDD